MKNPYEKEIIEMRKMALLLGWDHCERKDETKMLSFFRSSGERKPRINVYYSTMTVGTCIDHPVQGATQLFRRDVTMQELKKIFSNPRVHTNKGYKKS